MNRGPQGGAGVPSSLFCFEKTLVQDAGFHCCINPEQFLVIPSYAYSKELSPEPENEFVPAK
jgi:hypothetical protein